MTMQVRRKRAVFALGFVVASGAGLWLWLWPSASPTVTNSSSQAPEISPDIEATLEHMRRRNRSSLGSPTAQLRRQQRVASENQTGFSTETIQALADATWVMHEARAMLNRQELQEQEFHRIAADDVLLSLTSKVLTDLEFAEQTFGKDQALVRAYSARAMSYLGSHGKSDVCGAVAAQLGERLNQAEQWSKGVERDYIDVVAGYARGLGEEAILADLDGFLDKVEHTARTKEQVAQALYDSGVLRGMDEEHLRLLKEAIDRHST